MTDAKGPALTEFDLGAFTPYRIAVAAQRTSEELARQFRARFGITIPEWRVLAHLAHAGASVSVRDIEEHAAMEKSKVSRAASRLEASGHIVKRMNETDRRLVRLELTAAGCALVEDLLPIALAYQQEIEARLAEGFAAFEQGLARLLQEPQA
ncbi:MarR family winged helix-turn-helix transcriptional regulator [Salipiger marinus]|uniref:MarR family winged helix-turn-helix transcriptional regulator n=1 Tax=Salipiger marinus TaxID=555512 RepID=UPI004057F1B6